MIKRIRELVNTFVTDEEQEQASNGDKRVILIDPRAMEEEEPEPEFKMLGLFAEVVEEKIAELAHALVYINEVNLLKKEQPKPVRFYLSTYGGSADDMFALYDIMRITRKSTPIHTIGLGKVMSAGVLLLAAGTKGERRIGRNCRVMIHSVIGGNHGNLHSMINEMEAIEQLQQMYSDCLVRETKMTKTQLKKMLERKVNVYLSAEEAVELGIADIII